MLTGKDITHEPLGATLTGSDPIAAQLLRVTDDFLVMYRERQTAHRELDTAHEEILLRLALAAEYRGGEAVRHLRRIGEYAGLLAEAAGQSETYCQDLRRAAPLHDLGKIGLPDAVLNKPGRLNEQDWRVLRRHPEIGARLLANSGVDVLDMAADVALYHHERFDGLGYPQGVRGRDIPLSGRIVGLVDFFDVLTMERAYRSALPGKDAVAMVRAGSGGHFDPVLVEAFLDNQDKFLVKRDEIGGESHPEAHLASAAGRTAARAPSGPRGPVFCPPAEPARNRAVR